MHCAALVALAVVASSVLGSAAPAPTFTRKSLPNVTTTSSHMRDPRIRLLSLPLPKVMTILSSRTRDLSPCPLGVYRSDTRRRSGINTGTNNNKDEVIEGASSGNAKRQAPESHETFTTIY
ncbi:hypothetical protein EDD22DRAFT_880270 [Suillus occidentalis]|nr:hypothetical protein EDD22DRAFT_880270 [Suillus occidentalis]